MEQSSKSPDHFNLLALIASILRMIALIVFAWMFTLGMSQWPTLGHMEFQETPLTAESFEAITKCLTGLIGMILTDISISLARTRQGSISPPPKSLN
jgi:hypothetical protein